MNFMNKKGYVMTEALIISAVVLTSLVLIYMQFSRLNMHYNDSYYYNNVNDIYILNEISSFLIEESNFATITSSLGDYLDITSCNHFIDRSYCNMLINSASIKHLVLTHNNKSRIVNALGSNNPYDLKFYNFVKVLDDSDVTFEYLLIAEFNNGTFASIPMNGKRYPVYATGTPIYFNVTTGEECTLSEANANYDGKTINDINSGCMKFYVFNDDNVKSYMNLILDHNIGGGYWYRPNPVVVDNSFGPITALLRLKSKTDEWQGVEKLNNYMYYFNNGTENITCEIKYKDEEYKARLLTKFEANTIINYDFTHTNQNINNGYFTDMAVDNTKNAAYVVLGNKTFGSINVASGWYGIRPVIHLSKEKLS